MTSRRTALILFLLAVPAGADCIGNRSPENPDYRSLGGRMLTDVSDGHEYGIEVLCRERERLILFQMVEMRTESGEAAWKTLDSKTITLAKNQDVLVDSLCKWKGVAREGVIGIGHVIKSKDVVSKAFLANAKTGKLEPLPPAAVSCEEPDGEN
jgi:hypothetical protein